MDKEERPESTTPCPSCGRHFAREALQRHEPICRKQASKKRKVFDSGKQRATGSDVPLRDIRKVQDEIKKGQLKPPKTAWRERHEQFMSAVQSAKGVDYALKTGAPLPPPPKSTIPSDYVQCEYCGRHFNKATAERHIPFCKEQHARQASKPPARGSISTQPRNAPPAGQRRQPMAPSYGNHAAKDNGPRYGSGVGNPRGKTSSAFVSSGSMGGIHDVYDDYEERNGRSAYKQGGKNTRSISAGRAPQLSSTQSRVPVPQRRQSPVTRIPAYTKAK